MAGKTTIDTDLRDNLLQFLTLLVKSEDLPTRLAANELFWRLKPQRTRTRKLSKCSENEMPDFGGEPATHLQPSQ